MNIRQSLVRQTLAIAALSLMAGAAFAAPQAAPAAGAAPAPAAKTAHHKAKPHHHHAVKCKAGESLVAGKCEAKSS